MCVVLRGDGFLLRGVQLWLLLGSVDSVHLECACVVGAERSGDGRRDGGRRGGKRRGDGRRSGGRRSEQGGAPRGLLQLRRSRETAQPWDGDGPLSRAATGALILSAPDSFGS